MEKVDLKWEQNEVEVEEEEVGGLRVRSSKAIKEVTNGKIEKDGHANSTSKITNGTEKSDLGDEQERPEEHLSDSNNGVEVEEGSEEPKEVSVQKIVVSNNGIEEGTEKSDLDDELERSVVHLSDSNNGVEVEVEVEAEEEAEPKEVSVQKIVASNNGVEVEEETEPLEVSVQQIVVSNNGVEVEEGTEQKEVSVEQIVALNNWFEEGIEAKETSVQQIAASNNGVEVEEETEPLEVSVQQIVVSNNGVEVEEGTEQKEVSVEQIVALNNWFEEGIEAKETSVQQIAASNNGVEVEEETEPLEVSVQQIVVSNNGVEVEEGTEQKEVSVEQIVALNNWFEEEIKAKETSVQQIAASNNGVEVEEETEPRGESVQQIVVSNGVEKGTEVKEESEQHLVTYRTDPKEESVQQFVASDNGVEEGTQPKEVSVQLFVASNNGVEEVTEAKEESKQHLVTCTNGVEVEEGAEAEEVSVQQFVASSNGVEEGIEAKEESKQYLVTSTDGVEKGTEAEEGPFRSGHSVYYDKDEDSNFISTPSIKEKIDKIPGDKGVQESATLNIQLNGYLKSDNLSSSCAQLSKDLSEDHSIVRKSTTIDEIESADADLINDSDTDVKDFDVENVIQKQNTHDLYCPNCKSCITRRVILQKRKRKIRVSGDDVKRNKLEVVVDSKVDASHAQAADDEVRDLADRSLDGTPPLEADDYQADREPELFRCLSCLSFFIPTGSGFKLFRIFGEKGNKENVKGEQLPTTNKKWFSSIFALDKGKALVKQGSGIGANAVKNDSGVLMPSNNFKDQSAKSLVIKESAPSAYSSSEITQEAGGKILESKNQDANMKGKMVINTVGKSENATKSQEGGSVLDIFDVETRNQPGASASSKEVQGNDRNDELLRTTIKIQVNNGDVVQEILPASNDRKDELLRTGGRIQVSDGNRMQDSVPASQQNEQKLLITSAKEEFLTIEKPATGLKSDVAILNKDPGVSVLDLFEGENRNQPGVSAFSKFVQGNDRNEELLRTTGKIQVSNGNLVQESLLASNDRKDELLRTGGRIQVSDGNRVQDSVPASQQNELKLLITSTKEESLTIEKSATDLKSDVAILNKDPDNESLLSSATTAFALNGLDGNGKPKFFTQIPQEHEKHIEAMLSSESLVANNDNKFQLGGKALPLTDDAHHYEVSQHTITKTNIEIHSKQPLKVDEHALISSVKDALSIQDKPDYITNISVEAAANNIAGNDTIITVEAGHETTETASANLDTQIHSVEGQGTDAAEVYKIEIIKSIIFGGLAELITSLSVVASATGGDTSTLNILVLAMANLIGGLFIIFHNLWELKRDRFEQASNQIMENHVDRYREQLGRRENFTMHAVLVVLSYIIFGLVPPIIYGFSFRKSDDKELKIVAVAAASLVCILMLSIGKAYVQKSPKPYFKTISAYIILGFTVSGVSYAAGILFRRLLEKLGLFQPSSPANLLLPEMPGTGAAWASL